MTEKQRFKQIRARHLASFRRYVSLQGEASAMDDYLNMNAFELRDYLSSQWQPGMNWENYGKVWVVDHIVALKYFDPTDRKEMKLCWHSDNPQPSFYMDNHAKGCCVEVTEGILLGLKPSSTVKLLLEKIESVKDMFEPYYGQVG